MYIEGIWVHNWQYDQLLIVDFIEAYNLVTNGLRHNIRTKKGRLIKISLNETSGVGIA